MLDQGDVEAAELLADIADSSEVRSTDGKLFWGGFFRHRVARFGGKPLATFVSRIMGELRCTPAHVTGRNVVVRMESISPERTAQIEQAIRQRADLLVALTYETLKRRRAVHSKEM